MSSTRAEEGAVPPGSYHIKRGTEYLAVGPNRSIIVQEATYNWKLTLEGEQIYLQDPKSGRFLHDNTKDNVLDTAANKHGRWAGAVLNKYLPSTFV